MRRRETFFGQCGRIQTPSRRRSADPLLCGSPSYPLRDLSHEAAELLRLTRKELHLGLHIAVLNC